MEYIKNSGKLIVFEGPDGVGKSTLSFALKDYFQAKGIPAQYMAFPGKEIGTLGHLVYELHHNPQNYKIEHLASTSLQLLHIAAHIDAIENRIRPALASGYFVILDRYWWSTWVYGTVFGVEPSSLKGMIDLELKSWRDILPSCVLLIDRSKSFREEKSIGKAEWKKLRETYQKLLPDQRLLYPIEIVKNEGAVKDALLEITKIIDDNLSKGNLPPGISPNKSEFQLELGITDQPAHLKKKLPTVISQLSPAIPSEVYDTYWRFAAERQEIFFKKMDGYPLPWTKDLILAKYKFTNAYRASDRVSQFLIKNVIYKGDQSDNELFFRIILFKIFNKISTWCLLEKNLGDIEYKSFSFDRYDNILTRAFSEGVTVFSSAYIMPSGKTAFGSARKHRNYLMLLETMIQDGVPLQISECKSMRGAFELLRSYPLMGDFLAYQYVIDLNYSTLTNFSEMEFVIPGPGARDGIRKCFKDLGGLNEADIIRLVTERQDREFERLGIEFKSLFGRSLQLIDCQNLFCEVDKYARVAHPNITGISGRTRIKQSYHPIFETIEYWYPPKWEINSYLSREGGEK